MNVFLFGFSLALSSKKQPAPKKTPSGFLNGALISKYNGNGRVLPKSQMFYPVSDRSLAEVLAG